MEGRSAGGVGSGTGWGVIDLGEGSGCAKGTDVDGWIEPAFKERDVRVETEGAATRFVGPRDTEVGGISEPLMWSNASFVGVGLNFNDDCLSVGRLMSPDADWMKDQTHGRFSERLACGEPD